MSDDELQELKERIVVLEAEVEDLKVHREALFLWVAALANNDRRVLRVSSMWSRGPKEFDAETANKLIDSIFDLSDLAERHAKKWGGDDE